MTAPGRACTPCRQAFFLLSDVIGLSRVVNLMHDAKGRAAAGTETSLLGPFFREGAPEIPPGGTLANASKGTEIMLDGRITDPDGKAVPHAVMDAWQTSSDTLFGVSQSLVVMPGTELPDAPVKGMPSIRYDLPPRRQEGPQRH
jgi:hypothetical protein